MFFVMVEWLNPALSGEDFATVHQMSQTAEIAHYSRYGVFRVKAIPHFSRNVESESLYMDETGMDGYCVVQKTPPIAQG